MLSSAPVFNSYSAIAQGLAHRGVLEGGTRWLWGYLTAGRDTCVYPTVRLSFLASSSAALVTYQSSDLQVYASQQWERAHDRMRQIGFPMRLEMASSTFDDIRSSCKGKSSR